MKITRITVWAMILPLSKPYLMSGGRLKFEQLDSTFVCIDPVPGQGARNVGGIAAPPDTPGLGITPELSNLGDPVAVIA